MCTRRRVLAAWAVGLLVVLGSGCGADDPQGSLGVAGSTPAPVCFRGDDGAMTKHVATFTPEHALQLTRIRLADPENVALIEGVVLPFAGDPDVTGTFLRYPPGSGVIADSLMRWTDRMTIAGDGVEVDSTDGQLALLVGLRLVHPGQDGHVDGFTLAYADEGTNHVRSYPQALTLKGASSPCTADDFD